MSPFDQFVYNAFYGIVGSGILYGVHVLGGMKQSIDELNKSMAKIVEKMSWHEKEIQEIKVGAASTLQKLKNVKGE